jgi:predicted metal-dependent hydrolase
MPLPSLLHPTLTAGERRALLRRGADLFNGREYFAAHEAWEEVWRSTTPEPKRLLQGLIQAAAALHQIRDLHRCQGPRGTLAKALANLEPYRPRACGLDVAALIADLERWRTWLQEGDEPPPLPALRILELAELR